MRLYRDKDFSSLKWQDMAKNGLLGILLITGLIMCPKGDLYSIDYSQIKLYSIGILLITMSMMYYIVSLITNCSFKKYIMRSLAAIILIVSTIVSMIFISFGGVEIIVGLALLSGTVIGFLLNFII